MRDINKYSNNVMAQQLFLTLSLNAASGKPATFEASRAVLAAWWKARYDAVTSLDAPVIENGSGLSRTERITSSALARLLVDAYAAPYMPELIASLPQVGVDGTLLRSRAALGSAHLKTGSLNNVAARAGYVDSQKTAGRRYVLIAMVNSDNPVVIANARGVFDALINWTAAH
jgi:D-alanyl-D-alanine carboxypeptidase/D-alanyl-D-alanine-endopeptidase (penicillin-binding protein 4)